MNGAKKAVVYKKNIGAARNKIKKDQLRNN